MATVTRIRTASPAPTADPSELVDFNRRWVARHDGKPPVDTEERPARFLFIGCSDRHVPAHEMMGVAPDMVLEVRNQANLAPATDMGTPSCVEMALHQQVDYLLVCGHYGCRACAAALQPVPSGALSPWLGEVRDLYRRHEATLDALQGDDRARHVVELNVRTQCMHILELTAFQMALQADDGPQLHG